MRILLVQHLRADVDPVFVGRTLDGRFHVIWRQEVLGSAERLEGAIKLACTGPLHHGEFGLVPRFSPQLEEWKLCTGPDKPAHLRVPRRSPESDSATPPVARLRRSSSASERLSRIERMAGKPREPG